MNRRFFIIIAYLALVIYFVGFRDTDDFLRIYTQGSGLHEIHVEIARTPEEKRLGLMGREEVPDFTGMLFIYEENSNPIMWMKGMIVPLDIVFIGSDNIIKYIEHNVQPCMAKGNQQCDRKCDQQGDRKCNRYGSAIPSSYVLELPAGFAKKHGVDLGDRVEFPLGL